VDHHAELRINETLRQKIFEINATRWLGAPSFGGGHYAVKGDVMAADVRDWRDKMALRALGGDNKPGVVSRSFLVQSLAKYAMQPGKNELGGVHGLKCITSNQWFPLTTNRLEFGCMELWITVHCENGGVIYPMEIVHDAKHTVGHTPWTRSPILAY
jgi:hypothetical protein